MLTITQAPAPLAEADVEDLHVIEVQPAYGYDDGFDWSGWSRRMGIAEQPALVSSGWADAR